MNLERQMELEPRFVALWADRVRTLGSPWFRGSIFPSELVPFLAACDTAAVDAVVESGRQDGYSTAVLAAYGEERRVPVVSIDLPSTPERGAQTRARLAGRPNLQLIDGNTLDLIGETLPADAKRISLLVDGPKFATANRLLLAAVACFPIVLVAHHGYVLRSEAGAELANWFPRIGLTDIDAYLALPEVRALRDWERELIGSLDIAPRKLDESTLGVALVHPTERRRRRLVAADAALGELAAYLWRRPLGLTRDRPMPPALLALRWVRRRVAGRLRQGP